MITTILASARQARILRLLDEERRILLEGPLTALAAIVDRRESAMAEISNATGALPEIFVESLRAKGERNARLIQASLAGLRSADAEIARIEQSGRAIGTYSANGRRTPDEPRAATKDTRA
jgi:hypothetical protein